MKIQVLGTGCTKCHQTEQIVREALAQSGICADVEKVTDAMEIVKMGVMSTPAVVIDGRLVSSGRVPTVQQVEDWVSGAAPSSTSCGCGCGCGCSR